MTTPNFSAHLVTGTVTLERLNEITVSPILRSHVAALTTAHTAFGSGVLHADTARGSRKTALNAVVAADTGLAESLHDLAGEIVVARLGTLQQPFASFGGKGVSRYASGSRVRAVKEVTILLDTIAGSNPPAAVHAAVHKCAKQCRAVTEAYAELGARRVDFRKARGVRQTAYEEFARALSDVRNIAKVAWRDQPETYAIVFGAIEKDRFGKKSHAKKKADPQPSTEPTTTSPARTVTPKPTATAVATPPTTQPTASVATTPPPTSSAAATPPPTAAAVPAVHLN